MATQDINANIHIKDESGNINNIYPATKIANVEGLQSALNAKANSSDVTSGLAGKVDKVSGKGLSTNDYTTAEKNKLAGIEAQANKTVVDSALSSSSTNPVQNKVINTALGNKADASTVATLAETVSEKADSSTVSALSSQVSTNTTNLATQTARIDSIASLPSGSTSGDAELMDIRVKADGTTASSAGDAVREQIGAILDETILGTKANINDSNVASICSNDFNNLPNNKIYGVGLTNAVVAHAPGTRGNITTFGKQKERTVSDLQIFTSQTNDVFIRIYWGSSWTDWKKLFNSEEGSKCLTYMGVINDNNVEAICDNDFNNLPSDKIYGVGLVNAVVDNCPNQYGMIITFGHQTTRSISDSQIFISDTNDMYFRIYWNYTWHPWIKVLNDHSACLLGTETNISDANVESICNNDFDNLPNDRIYGIGLTNAVVAHAPGTRGNITTIGKQKERTNSDFQIFTSEKGDISVRIYFANAWTKWKKLTGSDSIRVLTLGDSICYGGRNNNKGFIGDAGVDYDNIGVSGATLSTAVTDIKNIPNQLADYTATNMPDAIISNGGVNDYYFGAPLGTVPTVPVKNQTEANALDRSTVLGGLQMLFWNMINKFPKAQRFFLCTHKTTARPTSGSSLIVDWTVTKNSQNYTQTEMFNAIKATCEVYGVTVIDVFGRSQINTAYAAYKSDTPWSEDHSVGNSNFVDADGIHPLSYGYINGYVPLVKEALSNVSKK